MKKKQQQPTVGSAIRNFKKKTFGLHDGKKIPVSTNRSVLRNIRVLNLFSKFLTDGGKSIELLRVENISEQSLDAFKIYLWHQGFTNWTIKLYYKLLQQFIIVVRENPREYCEHIERRPLEARVIPYQELQYFLASITKENGRSKISENAYMNHYRPYLKDAYLLGYLTGLRGHDLANLKWENVSLDEKSGQYTIQMICSKLKVKKIYPVMENEMSLMGPSTGFVIAPHVKNREYLLSLLIRSFRFYYKTYAPEKSHFFKDLRISYLTRMYSVYASPVPDLVHHTPMTVIKR